MICAISWRTARHFLLALLLVQVSNEIATADPWEIKQFDVIGVEPEADFANLSVDDIFRLLHETSILAPYTPEQFRSVPIDETVKTDIEQFLHEAANELEAWGFPPPALKPIVQKPDGSRAYRVYLLPQHTAPGEYKHDCEGSSQRVLLLSAASITDVAGMSETGYQTIAHELFHAVQFNTPFYDCARSEVGSWVTEGQARAIGWDLAQALRPTDLGLPTIAQLRWGSRNYNARLQVESGGGLNPIPSARRLDAYGTASFWRYLAERDAAQRTGGGEPGPEPGAVSYQYLSRILSAGPIVTDCYGREASCNAEVDWLNWQLVGTFGKPLRTLYTNFVEALAKYGDARPGLEDGPTWRLHVFREGCKGFVINGRSREPRAEDRLETFHENSARCFNLKFENFAGSAAVPESSGAASSGRSRTEVIVELAVAAPGKEEFLTDFNAAVAGRPIWAERPDIYDDHESGQRVATWIFTLPTEELSQVVLTNVADEPSTSETLRDLPYSFTVLKEYAYMGTGRGPSAADIDAPLPIEFDDYQSRHLFRNQNENHENMGHEDVCTLQFSFNDSETRDALLIRMDHEGPITPGEYPIFNPGESGYDFDYMEGNPGIAMVGWGLGRGSPLTNGYTFSYIAKAGTLTLEKVRPALVVGRIEAAGGRSNCLDPGGSRAVIGNWFECPGPETLTVESVFSVQPTGAASSRPPSDACFESEAERRRRQQGAPSTPTPDATSPVEPPPPSTPPPPPSSEVEMTATEARNETLTERPDLSAHTPSEATGTGTGDELPEGNEWLRLEISGAIETTLLLQPPEIMTSGGCDGSSIISIGYVTGSMADESLIHFSIETADVVGVGETGTYTLRTVNLDYGFQSPAHLPESAGIRTPVRYAGQGQLLLSEHNARVTDRTLGGTVTANLETRDGRQVTVNAVFRFPMSCGVN